MAKEWYVKLQQKECLMICTATTKWVYAIVKSFTANGSLPCEQSYRAISRRAGVDDKTVKNSIQILIKNKWLEYSGEGTHLGGSYPVLKVRYQSELKFGTIPSLKPESAESKIESSEWLGTKRIQLNKLEKNLETLNVHEQGKEVAPEFADDIFKDDGWGGFKR